MDENIKALIEAIRDLENLFGPYSPYCIKRSDGAMLTLEEWAQFDHIFATMDNAVWQIQNPGAGKVGEQ
jgi:hypothetical protein